MLDLELLLAPADEAPPCGINLEYDAAFRELEKAATRVPPQEFGEHRTPGQEPKWPEVEELAKALLVRSKDVRAAVYLTRALVQTQGFAGIAAALALLAKLASQYWDGLHPQMEEDGDATMRVNALSALQDPEGLLPELRNAFLINSREHGQLRVRDIEVALGRLPAPEGANALSIDEVHKQLAAAVASGNPIVQAVAQAIDALSELRKLLSERVTTSTPDFKPLFDILLPLKKVCDDAMGENIPVKAPHEEAPPGPALSGSVSGNGSIRSRHDASRMLDAVCAYLEKSEPTNPAPLFIRRAQRLMSKSFVEIVEDLLPDGLPHLERMAGKFDSASSH